MIEFIQNIDTALFYFFNTTLANPVFDRIFPFITENSNWILVYVFFLVWMIWRGGKRGRIAAAALFVAILICDPFCSRIVKEIFGRIRPCSALDDVRLLVGCGAGKSFPSSHAANNFAAAVVLSYFFKQYRCVFYTIAASIAFSRVYCGVHYPLDALGGAAIGAIIGFGVVALVKVIKEKLKIKY